MVFLQGDTKVLQNQVVHSLSVFENQFGIVCDLQKPVRRTIRSIIRIYKALAAPNVI